MSAPAPPLAPPRRPGAAAVVVMGVSGSGKSTVGAALAGRLGCRFIEGDALHPAENVERMRAGQPLDDRRRAPWLAAVGEALREAAGRDGLAVASCSALKRRYRDALRAAVDGPVLFLWLEAAPGELARRIAGRVGHYMPVSLLQSQLDDLEPPGEGELWLRAPGEGGPAAVVEAALGWLRRQAPQAAPRS